MNLFNLTDLALVAGIAAVVGSLITVAVMRDRPAKSVTSSPAWENWNVEAAETLVRVQP